MSTNSSKIEDRDALCPVVLACDDAYAMPLATTLRSLTESNPEAWPIECYVLSDKISPGTRRKVAASLDRGAANIHWIPVDLERFRRFSTNRHVSRVTYARILISELLPVFAKRVLYLDTDLLVLGDLRPLIQLDLAEAVLGAVEDNWLDRALKSNQPGYENVPGVDSYFNAGVLLIDLERWRENQIAEKALDYLRQHPESAYSDQDALNIACDGKWLKMDARWNFQDHHRRNFGRLNDSVRHSIVHFVTNRKPWMPQFVSVNAKLYDAFRSRTCYARTRRERLTDSCAWHAARCLNFVSRWRARFMRALPAVGGAPRLSR